MNRIVILYADGACSGNGTASARGGWAAVLVDSITKDKKTISGKLEGIQTNQRAEITAVIKGLEALKYPCQVLVYSDSLYVISTMRDGWKMHANLDLWKILNNLSTKHKVVWNHVKGHSNNKIIDECDRLAVIETHKKEFV
jgi:ribonuclease HI